MSTLFHRAEEGRLTKFLCFAGKPGNLYINIQVEVKTGIASSIYRNKLTFSFPSTGPVEMNSLPKVNLMSIKKKSKEDLMPTIPNYYPL